ncbi:response regulator [Silvibacterium bohemicum]|nr:response regulator [Silvibacterium bohemicum]
MSLKVMIVDDSPSMRKIIRRVLALSGYDLSCCHEAGNGIEAIALLDSTPVDVVFTDINMPGMNGEELVEKMAGNAAYRSIPVLVVSTDRSDERLQRMLALGARGYLTKPFQPEALGEAIRKVLGGTEHAASAV